ncbi:MAG: hypothetical protein KIT31_08150 [Deltaproteobacteria bacterium]|nr:hypothetical protein [Deltaproteobacteria bacterium]
MPAAYLRCSVDADPRCLADFRAAFPGSPHDPEALARLAAATAAADCRAARPLLDEYLRRYPRGAGRAVIDAWAARCR